MAVAVPALENNEPVPAIRTWTDAQQVPKLNVGRCVLHCEV